MNKPTTYLYQIEDLVRVRATSSHPSFTGKVTLTDEQESHGHVCVASLAGEDSFNVKIEDIIFVGEEAHNIERLLDIHAQAKAKGVSPYPHISKEASFHKRCNLTSGTVMLAEGVRIDVWLHGQNNVPKCVDLMQGILSHFGSELTQNAPVLTVVPKLNPPHPDAHRN